ncbi:hypothetical protein PIROE2DRAFT_3795 [Piromyces sp. E2]|nr:hypothetical protein PIROE2DRAFT_3795 [Piromyces sp. E2]|eukprot:OUM68502.1 hypothetical protein PIROE2DRAFT_3795 [Piromyces sp. E2]
MTQEKTTFTIKEDGSDGDFNMVKASAQKYYENGINTLALGYFNVPDAPDSLNRVPIDYVENAAKYLKSIGYEKIGIWGISMGSLYVLLSACYYPDLISLVVAASPNYFVVQAMNKSKSKLLPASAFSYKGEDIPYEPYTVHMSMFKNLFESVKNLEPNFSYLYTDLMGKVKEEHIILVEKMKAHLILFSGKLDNLWPSLEGGNLIIQRLKDKNYAYPYEHIVCEYGGHLMVPFTSKLDKFMKANRKYPEKTEEYRQEHLNKIIETYRNW